MILGQYVLQHWNLKNKNPQRMNRIMQEIYNLYKRKISWQNTHNFPDHILHDLPNKTLDNWDHHCLKLQFQPESTEMEKKQNKQEKIKFLAKTFIKKVNPSQLLPKIAYNSINNKAPCSKNLQNLYIRGGTKTKELTWLTSSWQLLNSSYPTNY